MTRYPQSMAKRHASLVLRGLPLGNGTGGRGLQKSPTGEEKMLGYINRDIQVMKDVAMDKDQFLGKEVHIPAESLAQTAYPR
jgi:hypothetical protein